MSLFVPQNLFPRFMETFGATAAEVSRTTAITFAISGLLAPFVGAAIDRFGVVRVIRTGLLVLGLTFAAYPAARSLQDLYLLHAVIAVGLILVGADAQRRAAVPLVPRTARHRRWRAGGRLQPRRCHAARGDLAAGQRPGLRLAGGHGRARHRLLAVRRAARFRRAARAATEAGRRRRHGGRYRGRRDLRHCSALAHAVVPGDSARPACGFRSRP